ncbi:MAG: hypothetical protein K2I81_04565 [Alphaproteobacteria bacterium]|nr:hypothetical protein [Alphaproteobacteria bacterium]
MNNTELNKKLKKLARLATKAIKLRAKTKGAHDGKFLQAIFQDKAYKDADLMLKVEMLAKIYSVARIIGTTKDEIKNEELRNNLRNILEDPKTTTLFSEYQKDNYEIKEPLKEILLDTTCGSREKDGKTNTIISLLSKYGYYITNFQFPIYDNFARDGITKLFKQKEFKELLKTSRPHIELGSSLVFFYKYGTLLKACTYLPRKRRIDALDAFFWLYGVMKATQTHEGANKTFWWSGTCGYVGDKKFRDWYDAVQEFMGEKQS